jgi:hypothetical protein
MFCLEFAARRFEPRVKNTADRRQRGVGPPEAVGDVWPFASKESRLSTEAPHARDGNTERDKSVTEAHECSEMMLL